MSWLAGSTSTKADIAVAEAQESFDRDYPSATHEEKAQVAAALGAMAEFVKHIDPERTIKARAQGHVRVDGDPRGSFVSITVAEHVAG